MNATTLSVTTDPSHVAISVRDLIATTSRVDDVLDMAPLRFSLSVPIRTTPAARSGADKLAPALQRRLEGDVQATVEGVRKTLSKDVTALAESLRKLLDKDGGAAANAHEQSSKLIRPVLARIDEATDGLPARVRAAIDKLMQCAEFRGAFVKQKLSTVGTWGFQRSQGIRLRPGLIAGAPAGDSSDGGGERLWRDLSAARSHTRKFVLVVAGSQLGLAVGSTLGSADLARAREMVAGGGSPLYGDVSVSAGDYHFVLDKAGSQAKREKLAKRVRDRVKALCNKIIAVRFADDDKDEDEDNAAPLRQSR